MAMPYVLVLDAFTACSLSLLRVGRHFIGSHPRSPLEEWTFRSSWETLTDGALSKSRNVISCFISLQSHSIRAVFRKNGVSATWLGCRYQSFLDCASKQFKKHCWWFPGILNSNLSVSGFFLRLTFDFVTLRSKSLTGTNCFLSKSPSCVSIVTCCILPEILFSPQPIFTFSKKWGGNRLVSTVVFFFRFMHSSP